VHRVAAFLRHEETLSGGTDSFGTSGCIITKVTGLGDPYEGTDFYCDIALPNLPALDVVHEGEGVVAYHHTRPYWPVHIVVVPRRHVPSLTDTNGADEALAVELLRVVQQVARSVHASEGAARVLTNLGSYQDSKHLHIHVSSGEPLR